MAEYAPDLVTIVATYDDSGRSIEVRLNHSSITLDDIADLIRVLHEPDATVDPSLAKTREIRPEKYKVAAPPNNPSVWNR